MPKIPSKLKIGDAEYLVGQREKLGTTTISVFGIDKAADIYTKIAQDDDPERITKGLTAMKEMQDAECRVAGHVIVGQKLIELDPTMTNDIRKTFLHEVLHALGVEHQIPYWSEHQWNGRHCTDRINDMSIALLRWIRENPEAIEWLTDNERS